METKKINPSKQFLTLGEVQTYLGIRSRKTILKYISGGTLPAYKVGGTRWRIALEDVEAFLKKHLAPAGKTTSQIPNKVVTA